MNENIEVTRQLIETALTAGRAFQSAQTGYVHYCHSSPIPALHHTIPLYENLLFILALFRSRLIENIKEAQNLLNGLLAFQNEEGSFPYYLHEYPVCKHLPLNVQLMAPLYWIVKNFGSILRKELREQVERSIKNLMEYSLKIHQMQPFAYTQAIRFAASLTAFGKLFHNSEWHQYGSQLLEQLGNNSKSESWLNTYYLADVLIAISMAKEEFDRPYWEPLMEFIRRTWHPKLAAYCGPAIHERQNKSASAVHLYDIYMAYARGNFLGQASQIRIENLAASLVYALNCKPSHTSFVEEFQGDYKEQAWLCVKHKDWALTLLEKNLVLNEKVEKTYTPLRLLWGNPAAFHSLVCQGGNSAGIHYRWNEPIIELTFDLEGSVDGNLDKAREICFYLTICPEIAIKVNQQRSTAFELNQEVKIELGKDQEIGLTFELLEGKGNFLGHIAQANRPSQIKQSEDKKSQAYDWTIFLRTLRRSEKCKIKVKINLSSFLL